MQEGQSKSKCIYKITTIFRRTKVEVVSQLRENAQFSYFPLVWLFCTKGANYEIIGTHKLALRALYGD